jgi:DNA-directed RNA polymerase specialized sigma24 family protein
MVGSLVPEDDWQKVIRTAQSAREKRAELERMIFDCLVARLSPEDRKLIELWRTTGSRLELAIATNRSEKSINTQLFRAKKRLKKIAIDHGLTSEFL